MRFIKPHQTIASGRIGRRVRRYRRVHFRHPNFELLEPRLALSVTLLNETFQSDIVGTLPHSPDQFWNATGPESYIQVAGTGGTYVPPFGGSTNKALVIDDVAAAQPIVSWRSIFSDDPVAFTNGSFEFDLYLPSPGTRNWTFLDFRIGYGGPGRTAPTTVNDTTVWNSFRIIPGSTPDIVLDDGNNGGSTIISQNTLLHVRYDLNGTTKTYQLRINGTLVTFGGNPDRPWRSGAPGVNMFGFFGSYPTNSAPVYIDNIVVVNNDSAPVPWFPPADEPTNRLEWYQHRGNKRLTGEATFHQDIVTGAQVLWSDFIGSREGWMAVSPSPGQQQLLAIPTQAISMSQSDRISFGIGGPYFDLSGTGTLTAQSTSSISRIGDFIPGNGKTEKVEGQLLDTTFGQGVVRLFVYDNGNWVQQWQSVQIPAMQGIPNLIVGDFDNDGTNEVALTPWTNIYILNINTGAIERTGQYKPAANESGRGYGWFGAYDFSGDGRDEFVVMGDFQDFVSVVGWNASGNLVQLWTHVFDPDLSGKQTAHRPMAFPVRDITGDGRPEIVTSAYNESGDQKWHLVVLDSLTGAVMSDLVDHVIDGARDVDGNGDYELFVRTTQGALLSDTTTLKILNWNGSGFNTLWTLSNAGFVRQDIQDFPVNVNSATATGKSDLLTGSITPGGLPVFFTRKIVDASTSRYEVEAWQLNGAGGATSIGTANGINLDALAVRAAAPGQASILFSTEAVGAAGYATGDYNLDGYVDGADYILWRKTVSPTPIPPGTGADGSHNGIVDVADYTVWRNNFGAQAPNAMTLNGFSGSAVFAQQGSPPRSSAVVGRLDSPTSAPTVVVQAGSQTIVALQPNVNGQVSQVWSKAGIGGFQGATQFQGQHENSGVALADVNGDGDLETIYATQSEGGQARLVAAAPDGSEAWHADFDVPGGTRIFNQPGLTLWRTGHFRTTAHEDVLVQIMRGSGGTGEFQLLDGVTGHVVWVRTYGPTPGGPIDRNAGEAQMAVYDWDGDGLDEAVNLHPDMYYVVDGTGINLVDRTSFNQGIFPGGSPLYATPIVADFLHNHTDTVLFGGSYAQLGLMTKNGAAIWNTPFTYDNTPGFIQGVGDVDGDGDLDLLSPGHPSSPGVDTQSRFNAYDAATGTLLWQVNLPGHAFAPVGGAYADTPTLSVSGDIDNDGRVESVFAIGSTLYIVGANPGGTSGQIEKTITPDGGLLGSPILADANGDGLAEIIVVSTSGMIYGIGRPASAASSAGSDMSVALTLDAPNFASVSSAELAPLQPQVYPMGSAESLVPTAFNSFYPIRRAGVAALSTGQPTIGGNELLVITLADTGSVDNAFDSYYPSRGGGQSGDDLPSTSADLWETASDKLVESLLR